MRFEDFIPHRQLINLSLRKASADLKVQISAYQTRYEQKLLECKTEINAKIANKNQHFEKIKQAYVDQLQGEAAALESTCAIFFKYVDEHREVQLLRFQKEKIGQELILRKEHCNFLREQIRLLDEDIATLTERKNILAQQSDIEDIKALIQLSQGGIECLPSDNAKTLLDKVNSMLRNSEELNESARQSLRKLYASLQERAEFLSVIQYISWLIKQKEDNKQELKGTINVLQAERKELFASKDELDKQINGKNQILEEYAVEVRNIWAKPLANLLIERARIDHELSENFDELKSVQAALQRMMDESSDDSDRWERLQETKRYTKSNISELKSQKATIHGQIEPWSKQRNSILNICKSNNIYLFSPKDGQSDELRVLTKRKSELLLQIEQLLRDSEQAKEKKKVEFSPRLVDMEQQITRLQEQESKIKQRLTSANADIEHAKERDDRILIVQLFSDSYEVKKAKEKKTAISRELGQVQNDIRQTQSNKKQLQENMDKALVEIDSEYKRKISIAKSDIAAIDRAIAYQEKQKNNRKKVDTGESKV